MPSLLDLSFETLNGIVDHLEMYEFRQRYKLDIQRLAQAAPYPCSPFDTLRGIVDNLELDEFRQRYKLDILRLAQASRYLCQVVHPRLYRELEFDGRNPNVIRNMEAISEMLQRRPDLARTVQDVSVNYSWSYKRGLTYSNGLVRRFLGMLPRIRTLAISLLENYTIREMFPGIYSANTLREVEIYHYRIPSLLNMTPLLAGQNLVSLDESKDVPADDGYGTSSICHLKIGGFACGPVIAEIIRWPKYLQTLTVNCPNSPTCSRVGRTIRSSEYLSSLLEPLMASLRELMIDPSLDNLEKHDGSWMSFEGYENLTSLTIPALHLFGGWDLDRGRIGVYKRLPRTLQKIMIILPACQLFQDIPSNDGSITHGVYNNFPGRGHRREREVVWLLELVENKPTHYPNLEKVYIREAARGRDGLAWPPVSLLWEPTVQVKDAFESAAIHLVVSLYADRSLSIADQKRFDEQTSPYLTFSSF